METDSCWNESREMEAVKILAGEIEKDIVGRRRYYHTRETFELIEIAGVRRVRRKVDQRLMATAENMKSIVRDVHVAVGHKGETKHPGTSCDNHD